MQKVIFFMLLLASAGSFAQQSFRLTDIDPVTVSGLTMGYSIKSEEEKEVGNKGNFSRYAVRFYISNNTPEAKIMLYKEGLNILGNVSDQLVQFNCLNATGARLTSKSAVLNAAPCNVLAIVDDKDCNGKMVKNKRFVQIGYWIRAGQTISTNAIMIVPLNEKPNIEGVYLGSQLQPIASAGYADNQLYSGNTVMQPSPPLPFTGGYIKLRNAFSNNYINLEKGPLVSSFIKSDWWSAQWQLAPVNGTNYYTIQNRWKNNFISIANNGLLSDNTQSTESMWLLETSDGGTTCTLRNAARDVVLAEQNGMLQVMPLPALQQNARWIIER